MMTIPSPIGPLAVERLAWADAQLRLRERLAERLDPWTKAQQRLMAACQYCARPADKHARWCRKWQDGQK
jgi:hypothetical protein